ncbi:exonuclease SbcCD subunit D [Microbacterium sp. zg.Y625]|uniref:exonuclease SbcCD subunit D n=1 Tax=Microbacterium jiangjiandongii TaxID=3049071 RepID=UPI00214ACB7E|nr:MULTISPECIES: exonuclease SbcCD subunit D [unclassified Microbacterium]MCR2792088.1 exonuclease SbcCD subunit D [Microbacterium sp. zg.Y625]WIM24894.1 exonuclease SbcCD subunit D [Microbacterium sp. zg-Y625]
MRILHTSDWHIGRTFHGHSTLDALRGVLDALVSQVRENDVDVVIVAGDVFDSATPAAGCYALLSDTLAALADTGAQVVVTSGNHDSAARLGFQSALLRPGVHVVTDPQTVGTPITATDEDGPVHIYGIPFLEPALLRHTWPGVRCQADVVAHAMDLVRADLAHREGERSVAVAHCFAAGVEPTPHLERDIQQGGLDVVPLSTFDGVDYMALGHIHGRQRLSERVRYAGAPLHYSFGEGNKPRGSWLVDLDAGGLAAVTWLELPVPRRLTTLVGPLDELLSDERFAEYEGDWVSVEYTDTLPQRDPMRRLQERFSHCACVAHRPANAAADDGRSYAQRVRSARSDRELLDAFLRHVREGDGASDRETALIDEMLDDRTLAEAAT